MRGASGHALRAGVFRCRDVDLDCGIGGDDLSPAQHPHDAHRDPRLELLLWLGFFALVLTLLAIDLGVHRKQDRILPLREALAWTGFYVSLALVFSVFVYLVYEYDWMAASAAIREDLSGGEAALYFFTAWLLEWSLALDNIFVIALIFSFFQVPAGQQHRVLFWGILGALVFRAMMIVAGVTLIHRFEWIVYLFGGLLLFTAMRVLVARHDNLTPDRNPLVKFCHRCIPLTEGFRGSAFFVREGGRLHATPLALALMVVESTDLLFAVDSIPAALAITTDPFLVFTSNIFAVLGLRALYFALAALLERFRYLKMSLVFILAFVGIKFILSPHFHMPAWVSLVVIGGFLGVGALASVLHGDTAPLLSPLRAEAGSAGKGVVEEGGRVAGGEDASAGSGS
jgi:tellurite resistance protein TerC